MSGRSPSGVASLRARFETKGESTSPPSRGRSPAGSVNSDSSRPLSKVRATFVSVEGRGRMGDRLGLKESTRNEAVVGDGADETNTAVNGDILGKHQPNGGSLHSAFVQAATTAAIPTEGLKHDEPKSANLENGAADGLSDASPDKPFSTVEDGTPNMLPSDPKDEEAVSGGAALGDETTGLGSILKGSPFEQEKTKKSSVSKSEKPKTTGTPTQPPKIQTKAPVNSSLNGKSKEPKSPKPTSQSKPKAAPPSAPTASIDAAPRESSDTANATDNKLNGAPLPATIESQASAPLSASNISTAPKSRNQNTIPPEPRTPTDDTASGERSTPKKGSPKPARPRESNPEPVKDTKKPIDRTSAVSKQSTAASSKPSKPAPLSNNFNPRLAKKPDTTSPKQSFSKTRPKSPTRPVRLPAAATAPTAASAAKVDGSPQSGDRRKPTGALASKLHTVGKLPQYPAKSQSKPTRTSLPASAKPVDKAKAPNPRTSMASSKAVEGSFLERMMRPTQSSSQKTHDKPPKPPHSKQQGPKPKRTSEGSDSSKPEHEETNIELSKQSASTELPPAESGESPNSNAAFVSVSAAAHTVPATNPAP